MHLVTSHSNINASIPPQEDMKNASAKRHIKLLRKCVLVRFLCPTMPEQVCVALATGTRLMSHYALLFVFISFARLIADQLKASARF